MVEKWRKRTKSKKILSTPLGNRRAAAWNEGAKKMRERGTSGLREKDKLTERAAAAPAGVQEKEGRKRLLFTLRRSRRLRGLVPSTNNYGEDQRGRREDEELKGGKVELTAYHVARAESISEGNCYSEFDLKWT